MAPWHTSTCTKLKKVCILHNHTQTCTNYMQKAANVVFVAGVVLVVLMLMLAAAKADLIKEK